jgi:hypothetical protein
MKFVAWPSVATNFVSRKKAQKAQKRLSPGWKVGLTNNAHKILSRNLFAQVAAGEGLPRSGPRSAVGWRHSIKKGSSELAPALQNFLSTTTTHVRKARYYPRKGLFIKASVFRKMIKTYLKPLSVSSEKSFWGYPYGLTLHIMT